MSLLSASPTDLQSDAAPLALCIQAAAREPHPQTVRRNVCRSHTRSPPARDLPPPHRPDPPAVPPAHGAPETPANTNTAERESDTLMFSLQERARRSHQLSAIFEHLLPGVILAVELLQEALTLLWENTSANQCHTRATNPRKAAANRSCKCLCTCRKSFR